MLIFISLAYISIISSSFIFITIQLCISSEHFIDLHTLNNQPAQHKAVEILSRLTLIKTTMLHKMCSTQKARKSMHTESCIKQTIEPMTMVSKFFDNKRK